MFYIVDDEALNSKFDRFFNTYFIQDHIMENKKVMTVEFFEANKETLDVVERDILRSLFESYVSVYTIEEINDDKVLLKDCLNDDVEIYTEDVLVVGRDTVTNNEKKAFINKIIDNIIGSI